MLRDRLRRGCTTPEDIEPLIHQVAQTRAHLPDSILRGLSRSQSFRHRVAVLSGHVLKAEPVEKLLELLDRANGTRRTRLLDDADVARSISSAIKCGVGWNHGGVVANCYPGRAFTTMCLARRTPKRLVVGVSTSPANHATPGRAWHILQPWRPTSPKLRQRLIQWSKDREPDRITFKLETVQ